VGSWRPPSERIIGSTTTPTSPTVPSWQFDLYVSDEADGIATAEQLAVLEADRPAWRARLRHLLVDVDEAVRAARALPGDEGHQVLADLRTEQRGLAEAWQRLTGEGPVEGADDSDGDGEEDEDAEPGVVSLQLSWEPGRIVAWAAGPHTEGASPAELNELLAAAGAPSTGWSRHGSVSLPDGGNAPAVAIPVGDVLGWLVAVGAGDVEDIGPSVRWLGQVAIWAVDTTASGSMVPLLRQRKRGKGNGGENTGSYSVRWTPALIDPDRLASLTASMPGAVLARDPKAEPRSVVRSALTGMVDAICRDAARRVEVPAPPPHPRTAADVAEAYLGRLDGSAFSAPLRVGGEAVARIEKWAGPVTGTPVRLVVQLDPPDSGNAWDLMVLAPIPPGPDVPEGTLVSVEEAIAHVGTKGKDIEDEMARLERMVPALLRPGGMRRGQVVLSQAEAWELMSETGPHLASAGFDVRIPELSRKKATPSLRVFAESTGSVAGANQLANVRWSALFDDVELSAADIARLAREARPLVRSRGRWVAIDQADLKEAAAALAERESTTKLSGAEMLRLALGLDGSPLAGGISIGGESWAADLLRQAETISQEPAPAPDGFVGELRSYQAEALAWLGFLDSVGLGGCLALDMGLGKTPTMLAHLLAGARSDSKVGPSLVVAPPAVVGNWAAEAARFTPSLRVVVHHGTSRAAADEVADEVARADLVITTYGTAIRDMDAIEAVQWDRVVLDEAQAIKNPANETSQQLRRLQARTRVALTGTPIENGLGDLWAILDFTNPGLVGPRPAFIANLSSDGSAARVEAEDAMRALNGILVFRRTKAEPAIAAELPDRIDQLDHCAMTPEQVGLYQAVLDKLVTGSALESGEEPRKGQVLAAITALKQICNHPSAYQHDDGPLAGRSGKLARLEEIVETVYAAGERVLVFTHFAEWGQRLAEHFTERTGTPVHCYHGGLARGARDKLISEFQALEGPGMLVLSLKAGGTGLNLTNASHVVLYDRWWNPAVEDQARDRAWRIGQTKTVIAHRLVCPGTVDERVEEVVEGKRRIAEMVLPKSSSLADLDTDQLRVALGMRPGEMLTEDLSDEPVAEFGRGRESDEASGDDAEVEEAVAS
jgi:superfamily II DNA or RNA helicase